MPWLFGCRKANATLSGDPDAAKPEVPQSEEAWSRFVCSNKFLVNVLKGLQKFLLEI